MRPQGAAAALLCATIATRAARGDEGLALAVVDPALAGAADVERVRVAVAAASPGLDWVEPPALVERALARRLRQVPDAAGRALEAAEGEFEAGRHAAAALDDEEAGRRFAAAQALLVQAAAVPGVARRLAEVALADAARLFAAGRRNDAHARLLEAARLAPDRALTEREAHPDLVRLAAAARAANAGATSVPLRVESQPAGATAFVDDRAVGSTPADVAVSPGDHVVRVEVVGHEGWGALVHAVPGAVVRATPAVDAEVAVIRALPASLAARDPIAVGRSVTAATRAMGAAQAVLCVPLRRHGRTAAVFEIARAGRFGAPERSWIGAGPVRLASSVATAEEVPRLFEDPWIRRPEPNPPAPPRTPFWRRWYVLAGGAVVVAAAAAAVTAAAVPRTSSFGVTVLPAGPP